MIFDELDQKYLGLHHEIATGEHPVHGKFRVSRSMHDESLIVQLGDRKFSAPLRKLIDVFFEELEHVDGLIAAAEADPAVRAAGGLDKVVDAMRRNTEEQGGKP